MGTDRQWTKEEQYKLARISISIPNSLDIDWQIDVKKLIARPPSTIRNRLKELAVAIRMQAREVFAHRGAYGARQGQQLITRVWIPVSTQGLISYRIDRSSPMIKQLLESCTENKQLINAVLRLLEETVPVQQIWLDTAEKSEMHSKPFSLAPQTEVEEMIKLTYKALTRTDKMTHEAAIQRLLQMEAFLDFKPQIMALIYKEEYK